MKIRGLLIAAAVLVAGVTVVAPSPAATPVTVAVLDTGIYTGSQAFAAGQVVAWRDFIANRPAPYDDHGHGTLTASMVAGFQGGPATPSFAPGTRLAIGKVADSRGSSKDAPLAAGIGWAVNTAGADIISISLGDSTPASTLLHGREVAAALRAARQAGVLVLVSNGNGLLNATLPGLLGPLQAHGSSPDVLAVGASGVEGLLATAEPEVVAQYTVTGPSHTSPNGLVTQSGTSFSTPLVAGYAARALGTARANGHAPEANQLELLIKGCAHDTLVPPTFEGYGVIDANQVPCALHGAATGTIPSQDAVNALWVETVSGTLRSLFG